MYMHGSRYIWLNRTGKTLVIISVHAQSFKIATFDVTIELAVEWHVNTNCLSHVTVEMVQYIVMIPIIKTIQL